MVWQPTYVFPGCERRGGATPRIEAVSALLYSLLVVMAGFRRGKSSGAMPTGALAVSPLCSEGCTSGADPA